MDDFDVDVERLLEAVDVQNYSWITKSMINHAVLAKNCYSK